MRYATEIHTYTDANMRDHVHEGVFRVVDKMEPGDYFLSHHTCKFCKARILFKVVDVKVAMYFQGMPVYNYITEGGSSYKSNLKHVSIHDRLVSECECPIDNYKP